MEHEMKIIFYGSSDDIIGISVDGDRDEVGGYISGEGRYSKAIELRSDVGTVGIRVHAIYDGCWSFAAGQIDESIAIPDGWTIRVEQEHAYSTRLVVDTGTNSVRVTGEDGKALHGSED
jgi:hypothetical protein